ncbi:hypothetical protein [Candidatus Tisiphia endosymbiont of Micropterix aruncella]|uniref:hypothetical protein n=1 Tax=Candidatus Tisiphia endosymbiont of Micropterix aruncella TaxID=3066271 RepID=UPI003AA8C31E
MQDSTSADNFLALPTNILSARVPPSLREAATQRLSNQEIDIGKPIYCLDPKLVMTI